VLNVYDYYFLSIEKRRGESIVAEYVVDLRFVDPRIVRARRVAWRWISTTLALLGLFAASVWHVRAATPLGGSTRGCRPARFCSLPRRAPP
jgi:hypothetical protein